MSQPMLHQHSFHRALFDRGVPIPVRDVHPEEWDLRCPSCGKAHSRFSEFEDCQAAIRDPEATVNLR